MRALLCLVTDRGVVRGLDMAWLVQDIYLNTVKIFDLNSIDTFFVVSLLIPVAVIVVELGVVAVVVAVIVVTERQQGSHQSKVNLPGSHKALLTNAK